LGWYTGRDSPNTRRLVVEHGGLLYDADSYADDLPYWTEVAVGAGAERRSVAHLVVPYALDSNDMRFATAQGFNSGSQFFDYLKSAFDTLYREGDPDGLDAPEDAVGRTALPPDRPTGTNRRAGALSRLCARAPARLDLPPHRHCAPLDRHAPVPARRVITLEQLNALAPGEFATARWAAYSSIPLGGAARALVRPFTSRLQLLDSMRAAVADAAPAQQLALIRAHPQLGVRARAASPLTVASAASSAAPALPHARRPMAFACNNSMHAIWSDSDFRSYSRFGDMIRHRSSPTSSAARQRRRVRATHGTEPDRRHCRLSAGGHDRHAARTGDRSHARATDALVHTARCTDERRGRPGARMDAGGGT
jgi:hypothetical protein